MIKSLATAAAFSVLAAWGGTSSAAAAQPVVITPDCVASFPARTGGTGVAATGMGSDGRTYEIEIDDAGMGMDMIGIAAVSLPPGPCRAGLVGMNRVTSGEFVTFQEPDGVVGFGQSGNSRLAAVGFNPQPEPPGKVKGMFVYSE